MLLGENLVRYATVTDAVQLESMTSDDFLSTVSDPISSQPSSNVTGTSISFLQYIDSVLSYY